MEKGKVLELVEEDQAGGHGDADPKGLEHGHDVDYVESFETVVEPANLAGARRAEWGRGSGTGRRATGGRLLRGSTCRKMVTRRPRMMR